MQTTANYGLKKPDGTDAVDIQDFNDNADVIDQKLKEAIDAAAVIGSHAATHQPGGTDPLPTAAPSGGLGTANAVGVSTSLARADHTHLAFDAIAPVMNGAASAGSAAVAARRDHVHPVDTSRAPLASPGLTGTPTAPTAAADTSTTQIATTAFVVNQAGATTPLVDGVGDAGTSKRFARADHVHPTDTSRAPSSHVGATGSAHGNATTSVDGFMSSTDKTKLDEISAGANAYTHPSGDGNLHVPATGTTNNGKVLKAGSTAGSLSWGTLAKGDVGLGSVDNTADSAKNVLSATKLTTARTISLTGDATGSVSFDGSANVSIATTVADDSHNHVINNIDGLQTALDAKAPAADLTSHIADYVRQPGYGLTAGTNTYTLTLSPAPAAIVEGMCVAVKIGVTNTGAATLNINGLGAKTLLKSNGELFEVGDLISGMVYTFRFAGTSFVLQGEGGGFVRIDFSNYIGVTQLTFGKDNTPSPLGVGRDGLAAASVGNYALFGGGRISSSAYTDMVDAYDSSLVKSTPTAFSTQRVALAAASIGNYALFAGGMATGDAWYAGVDAYNTSLTKTSPSVLTVARGNFAGTTVGNYALFGGGVYETITMSNTVNAYNTSLTRSTPSALSTGRCYLAAASIGNYALFAGGSAAGSLLPTGEVNAYNTSLTRSTPTAMSVERYRLAATSVGNYALFGGGYPTTASIVVDAYDSSLTRTTPASLSVRREELTATSVGNYALFGGGSVSSLSNVVDMFDTSLTRTTPPPLSVARNDLASTTIGDHAIFAGGMGSGNSYRAEVDSYGLYAATNIPVTIGSVYNFGSGEQTATNTNLSVTIPATGYIKYKKGTI